MTDKQTDRQTEPSSAIERSTVGLALKTVDYMTRLAKYIISET